MFDTDTERAAYAAGFADGRRLGNREMLDVLDAAREVLPQIMAGTNRRMPTLAELEDGIAKADPATLKVLRPYSDTEAMRVKAAAIYVGCSEPTVREWVTRFAIGRPVVTTVMVSRPAILMLLDNDVMALGLYLIGDRTSPAVTSYFERAGLAMAA